MTDGNLTLAIEAAVDGGSLSLLSGNTEIDHWIGEGAVSKSEDLMQGLSALLKKNDIKRKRIGTIVLSTEAGSSTGLKIGSATARGLTKAFGCCLKEVSLWDALRDGVTEIPGIERVLFPSGKNGIVCRTLERGKFSPEIQIIGENRFRADFDFYNKSSSAVHQGIISMIQEKLPPGSFGNFCRMPDLGGNFAGYIGGYASDNELKRGGRI